jgi:hypothetical protein
VVDAGLADRTVSVGIMRPEDFFRDEPDAFGFGTVRKVDRDLLESLRRGPADVAQDSEISVALARLIHDELEAFGTDGGVQLDEAEIRDAILALRAVVRRLGCQRPTCRFATTDP